jgi:hypothetical protein
MRLEFGHVYAEPAGCNTVRCASQPRQVCHQLKAFSPDMLMKRTKNLTNSDIALVIGILDGSSEKLTWESLIDEVMSRDTDRRTVWLGESVPTEYLSESDVCTRSKVAIHLIYVERVDGTIEPFAV